ncbi:hypothetical protein GCM10023083_63570 [Streptomyces phyllanthi]
MVLVVGLRGVGDGQDRGVLQLAGERVGDRALVGGRGREAALGEVVAVGEVRQHQRRVDRGDHRGDRQPARRHHLRHRLGLARVPQLDDREPGEPGSGTFGESLQLGDQVLAERTARTVVDQRGPPPGQYPGAVPDRPQDRALGGGRQVVVERHAVRDLGQQTPDSGLAGVGVQAADDRDGHRVRELAHGQPRFPNRFSNFSTRPAVSSTRAVPV